MSRSRASIFVLIFALGLALRLIGIGWGLPNEIHPGELPIHPDEHVAYEESARLYDSPSLMAFVWGGAFYPRTAAIVRATFGGGGDGDEYRRTLLGLRLLNAVMALATAALVAWLATTLHGISCGLTATALFLVSPAHVLDSHYARPDVLLVLLSTVALAAAVRFARGGGARWLPIGAFAAGLATATMLSGVIGFLPLVAATWERDPTREGLAHRLLLACLCIAGIGALGYVVGSFESFLHWDVFRAGIERAQSSHMGGHYRLPLRLLTVTASFAFGTAALLFGYAGLALLALRRRLGSMTVVCFALVGIVLLGRVGGSMMRHLLFLAPPLAIGAALALAAAAEAFPTPRSRRIAAFALPGLLLLLTLQLSLSYVAPMATSEDPRYRVGRWLAEHAPPGSTIATTRSYHGDRTYNPRLPAEAGLREIQLDLFGRNDPARQVGPNVSYLVTTDFAREYARHGPAVRFLDQLFEGDQFRTAARFGPPWTPLRLPDALGARLPGDLLYVRSAFTIFEPDPGR